MISSGEIEGILMEESKGIEIKIEENDNKIVMGVKEYRWESVITRK